MSAELVELVVMLAEALDAAYAELEGLRDLPFPLPDKLLRQLEERDAMALLLKENLPPELREELIPKYRELMAKTARTDELDGCPVDEDVVRELEAAIEQLRRRELTSPVVDYALRGQVWRTGLGRDLKGQP